MSLVSINQTYARKGRGGIDGNREYYVGFEVISDSESDNVQTVSGFTGVPRLYLTGFPTDLNARCVDLDISQDADSSYLWHVVAKFSTQLRTGTDASGNPVEPSESSNPADDNPINQPPEIIHDSIEFTRPVEKDTSGTVIVNSAGEPFDPPPMIEDSHATILIRKNKLNFNWVDAAQYRNAVNSEVFLFYPPGELKCRRLRATSHFERGYVYWQVEGEFEHNPDGWNLILVDRGYREVDPNNPTRLLEILDFRGQPLTKPANLLDGESQGTGPAGLLSFQVRREKDFNLLGLLG